MSRLSVNRTSMTHHKARYRTGVCNESDHAINLNRARSHSLGLQEIQGKQPVPRPPGRNKVVAPEVREVSELGNRCNTGLPVVCSILFQQL